MLAGVLEHICKQYNCEYDEHLNFDIETYPNEEFIEIEGYEGHYEITNYGRIWSIKNQIFLSTSETSKYGHRCVWLCKNGKPRNFKVHYLVLYHFKRKPEFYEECRHLDGDPRNNHIDNLEWGTRQDNMDDRSLHGNTAIGEHHGKSKLTEKEVKEIRRLYKTGKYSHANLARMFNVSTMPIFQITNYITWKHVE